MENNHSCAWNRIECECGKVAPISNPYELSFLEFLPEAGSVVVGMAARERDLMARLELLRAQAMVSAHTLWTLEEIDVAKAVHPGV